MSRIVVGFDATPLLGQLTGIGVYTRNLITALAAPTDGPELVGTAFTLRGRDQLAAVLPPGVPARAKPASQPQPE